MSVARGLRAGVAPAVLLSCACLGCAGGAHYVVRNQDDGIIAIRRDTPAQRAQAERLMHKHLPEGYVVDGMREVAVGPPYRTVTQVGFVREVSWHQDHEYLLTYHSTRRPVAAPMVLQAAGPGPAVMPAPVQPASAVVPAAAPAAPAVAPPPGLPPQPIPVGN